MSVNFFAQGDSIIFLPTECFPFTYDLNGFRPRVNWCLLSLCSFCIDFLYAFNFFKKKNHWGVNIFEIFRIVIGTGAKCNDTS